MFQNIIGIVIAATFMVSPLLIIKYLLRYSDKHPQRIISFQFKIPGCNVVLSLSDNNDRIPQNDISLSTDALHDSDSSSLASNT